MITGFVGQGRFNSIDKWGFILFSKNLTDDLKVFVGRKRYEKHLPPPSPLCYFGLIKRNAEGGKAGGASEKKNTPPPPPPPPHCYLLSTELIMYIGLY